MREVVDRRPADIHGDAAGIRGHKTLTRTAQRVVEVKRHHLKPAGRDPAPPMIASVGNRPCAARSTGIRIGDIRRRPRPLPGARRALAYNCQLEAIADQRLMSSRYRAARQRRADRGRHRTRAEVRCGRPDPGGDDRLRLGRTAHGRVHERRGARTHDPDRRSPLLQPQPAGALAQGRDERPRPEGSGTVDRRRPGLRLAQGRRRRRSELPRRLPLMLLSGGFRCRAPTGDR